VLTINRNSGGLPRRPAGEHPRIGQKLHQQGTDPTRQVIYLRADENVPFGALQASWTPSKQAGITDISIVTQPLEAKASVAGGR